MNPLTTLTLPPLTTPIVDSRTGCLTREGVYLLQGLILRTGGEGVGAPVTQTTLRSSAFLPMSSESDGDNDAWAIPGPPGVSGAQGQIGMSYASVWPDELDQGENTPVFAPIVQTGDYFTATTSGTSLTSGTSANATSITLGPGDWDVQGVVFFSPAGGTTIQVIEVSVGTISATLGGFGTGQQLAVTMPAGNGQTLATTVVRVSLASSATVYIVAKSTFINSTLTCNGFIRARRVNA